MKVLHSYADAEDLLQDVFLEIWIRAANYNPLMGRPFSWIATLARRRSIDRLRRQETYLRLQERFAEETHSRGDGWTHVHEDVAQFEINGHLQRAMAILPEAQRKAIKLAYHKQMSQREIAAHTGLPLGTVKTRLALGLRKMAASLSGLEDLLWADRRGEHTQKEPCRPEGVSCQPLALKKRKPQPLLNKSNNDSMMKTLVSGCLATAAFLSFSACTTVEDRGEPFVHSTTTTTTEESTVRHPAGGITETRTTHSY